MDHAIDQELGYDRLRFRRRRIRIQKILIANVRSLRKSTGSLHNPQVTLQMAGFAVDHH
jgi:hypothetical protein